MVYINRFSLLFLSVLSLQLLCLKYVESAPPGGADIPAEEAAGLGLESAKEAQLKAHREYETAEDAEAKAEQEKNEKDIAAQKAETEVEELNGILYKQEYASLKVLENEQAVHAATLELAEAEKKKENAEAEKKTAEEALKLTNVQLKKFKEHFELMAQAQPEAADPTTQTNDQNSTADVIKEAVAKVKDAENEVTRASDNLNRTQTAEAKATKAVEDAKTKKQKAEGEQSSAENQLNSTKLAADEARGKLNDAINKLKTARKEADTARSTLNNAIADKIAKEEATISAATAVLTAKHALIQATRKKGAADATDANELLKQAEAIKKSADQELATAKAAAAAAKSVTQTANKEAVVEESEAEDAEKRAQEAEATANSTSEQAKFKEEAYRNATLAMQLLSSTAKEEKTEQSKLDEAKEMVENLKKQLDNITNELTNLAANGNAEGPEAKAKENGKKQLINKWKSALSAKKQAQKSVDKRKADLQEALNVARTKKLNAHIEAVRAGQEASAAKKKADDAKYKAVEARHMAHDAKTKANNVKKIEESLETYKKAKEHDATLAEAAVNDAKQNANALRPAAAEENGGSSPSTNRAAAATGTPRTSDGQSKNSTPPVTKTGSQTGGGGSFVAKIFAILKYWFDFVLDKFMYFVYLVKKMLKALLFLKN